ncbi:hypothetical protein GEMRC1_000037 [Eukaryota sp. GEM-RC1]
MTTIDSFDLQKEELKKELENLRNENELLLSKNNELEAENLVLCNQFESFKQKAKTEENERRIIELNKNLFNSNVCGSLLSLSNNNTVVEKNGSNGSANSFLEVNLSDNCSVKFTRLDDLHGDGITDFIGWKDRNRFQNGSLSTCIGPRGNYSEGSFAPSKPSFPTITRGESITVSFSNGKAYFKPSTCTTTFSIDTPSYLVFGMTVYGQNHEWKVERV